MSQKKRIKRQNEYSLTTVEQVLVNGQKMPYAWNMSQAALDAAMETASSIKASKQYAMCAGIPIICQGHKCAYLPTCHIHNSGRNIDTIKGSRCPIEMAEMVTAFNKYIEMFEVDVEDPKRYGDLGLIKELVDYDIQLKRADNRNVIEGDYLEDRIAGFDPATGKPIVTKEITKHLEFKDKVTTRRHQILQLLNATPKDKSKENVNIHIDPSSRAAELLRRATEAGYDLNKLKVIDVEPVKIEEQDDEDAE